MSEACLTLNVVRGSSASEGSDLPVGVWIHGGGFYMGSGSDERYNMSAIVENSYKIGRSFWLSCRIDTDPCRQTVHRRDLELSPLRVGLLELQ